MRPRAWRLDETVFDVGIDSSNSGLAGCYGKASAIDLRLSGYGSCLGGGDLRFTASQGRFGRAHSSFIIIELLHGSRAGFDELLDASNSAVGNI